jgi:phage terminase Nu1 subunit (DNA packaging protein)
VEAVATSFARSFGSQIARSIARSLLGTPRRRRRY